MCWKCGSGNFFKCGAWPLPHVPNSSVGFEIKIWFLIGHTYNDDSLTPHIFKCLRIVAYFSCRPHYSELLHRVLWWKFDKRKIARKRLSTQQHKSYKILQRRVFYGGTIRNSGEYKKGLCFGRYYYFLF